MKSKLTIFFFLALVLTGYSVKAQYCTPVHTVNCSVNTGVSGYRDSDIRKFIFNTIQNNNSTCATNGYMDFSAGSGNLTTTVYPGQNVPFYIQGGYVNPTHFAIWVDWDNNQTFDPAEMLWASPTTVPIANQAIYGYLTIPAAATAGPKRMRVRANFANVLNSSQPCSDITGETEDYTITVAPAATMAFSSVGITPVTQNLMPGMTKSKILLVNIQTTGNNTPLNLTELSFSLTGNTSVKNAKLYWGNAHTSYDSILYASSQLGTTLTSLSSSFSFTGLSRALNPGNNYVWLTLDIDSAAAINSNFSAKLDGCKINGSGVTVGSTPSGSRTVVSYVNYRYFTATPTVKVRNNAIPGPNTYNIGNVVFEFDKQINTNSADLDTLTFYTVASANVNRTGIYPYSGRAGVQTNLQSYVMWVDWDNDGMYDPVAEEVAFANGITTYAGNLTIPCSAALGPHRMRLATEWLPVNPYWSINFNTAAAAVKARPNEALMGGDVEEYTLNILADLTTTANFTHDSIGYRGGFTRFFDKSTGIGNQLEWDLDNDGNTDATSPNPVFQYNTAGWKVVKLKVTNIGCNGTTTSTFIDSVFISSPVGLPTADWVVNRNITDINLPVEFTDKSFDGPNSWNWVVTPAMVGSVPSHQFVNGTSATSQNPQIQFLFPGQYTIKCTVGNINGTGIPEERANYIRVLEPDNMCGTLTSSSQINGFLYDDGGAYNNYLDFPTTTGQLCTFLIEPNTCVDEIYLRWNDFDVNLYGASTCPNIGGDIVRIFDGEDNTGLALHAAAGFPNGFTNGANNVPIIPPDLVAKSGKVYIEFFKNCAFNGRGFGLEWYSTPTVGAPLPKAEAIVPDTVYIGEIVDFRAIMNEKGLNFYWDIDNNGTIEWTDTLFTTGFNVAGPVTVVLLAENCAGIDSFIKVITVLNPGAPVAQFEAAHQQILVGEKVQFTDLSGKALFDWSWSSNRSADIEFTDNTDFFSPNPVIRFNAAGKYDISLSVLNIMGSDDETKIDYIEVIGGTPCYPVDNVNTDIGISRVRFEGINNGSAVGQSSYSNFVGNGEAILEQGLTYPINIERVTTFDRMTRAIWIDWNGDGDFDDTLELVAYENPARTKNFVTDVTVPGNTVSHFGPVRMRIGASLGYDTLLSCGSLTNIQEYEDYRVVVRPAIPVITLTGNDTLIWNAGTAFTDPGYSAVDYLGNNINSNVLVTGAVNELAIGDYLLTYNVKDALGTSAITKTRLVQVRDTIRPVITLVGNDTLRIQVGYPLVDPGVSPLDNLDPNVKINIYDSTRMNTLGFFKIVYEGEDFSGNRSARLTRYVLVFDTIAPFVQLIGPDTVLVDVNTSYTDNSIFRADNYYATSTLVTTPSGTVDITTVNDYTLTYKVTDGSGNHTTVTRVVKVVDRIAPTIAVHDPIIIKPNTPKPTLADSVVLDDNYYSAAVLKPLLQVTESIDMTQPNIYAVSYQVTDPSGNASLVAKGVVIVTPTAGISALMQESITVYPNPSDNGRYLLTWKGEGFDLQAQNITVYNALGQSIPADISFEDNKMVVQLKNAVSGTYYLRVQVSGEAAIFKLVKQ